MRVLLILSDPAQRTACSDYFDARGCEADVADSLGEAMPFLQFRRYDLAVGDLPVFEPAEHEIAAFESATRDAAAVRVLLTAIERPSSGSLHLLTKPQPLDALFSLANPAA